MALHRWSMMCSRAAVEADTNNLTITGVVDDLQIGGLTMTPDTPVISLQIGLMFVSQWRRSDENKPENLQMRLVFHDPAGAEIAATDAHDVNLRDHAMFRSIANMPVMPMRGWGIHRIVVQARHVGEETWQEFDRVPIHITAQNPEPPADLAPR